MADKKRRIGKELIAAADWMLDDLRGKAKGGRTTIVLVPDVKAIRKKLKVSQAEFARRFHLNTRTVQQWEQGRAVPDQPARVLLTVIDQSPQTVERAVGKTLAAAARAKRSRTATRPAS
ncbi:MAG: helix-turn-helix domain-containing protein [Rhodospirillaceae bacterium]|nr:MAG: helix-turn-helix domain-containing protein [Rhodospirillaceae bacterium]